MTSEALSTPADFRKKVERSVKDRRVALWLLVVAALIFAMILIGGATRLTGSGLSIVEWQPVSGVLPPLNDAQWQQEFANYQQHPQFQTVNRHMTLAGFKGIFWLEYFHRLLGRFIGAVFLVPFLFFWARGYLKKEMVAPLAGLFVLGGLQGALGWFMVMSGLVDVPAVSHFRLAAHLSLAVVLYLFILWTAWGLISPRHATARPQSLYTPARLLLLLVFGQLIMGAFVAGLDAGYIHNTWPSMDGHFIPPNVWTLQPPLINLVDNPSLVQFEHRMVAYTVLAFVLFIVWRASKTQHPPRAVQIVLLACLLQVSLGIVTVVSVTPVALGVAHQGGAIILITSALYLVHRLRAGARSGALA
jgi:cytochrome c oxidase assembly protein subunit 15